MLLPGGLIVFAGFNAGGYFPATPAILAIVLLQILLVRIVQAPRPFEGLTLSTLVALVALALYALSTLLSVLWSHASGRALIEFDRAWLYLLVLLLLGSVRPSTHDLRWLVRGLLLGASVVCLAGLTSRVLPNVWPTAPDVSNQRLSYPVTYWNTLGLLAALGIVLALHLACTLTERRPVRVLAAGVLPLLAATLFFTFSRRGDRCRDNRRGGVYVLCARPRGLLSGVLATVPPSVALIVVAYPQPRQPAGHGPSDHAGGGVAGSSCRGRGRHLRAPWRRTAPALSQPCWILVCAATTRLSGPARARERGAPWSPACSAWWSWGGSCSALRILSRATGVASSAARPPAAVTTCASA